MQRNQEVDAAKISVRAAYPEAVRAFADENRVGRSYIPAEYRIYDKREPNKCLGFSHVSWDEAWIHAARKVAGT